MAPRPSDPRRPNDDDPALGSERDRLVAAVSRSLAEEGVAGLTSARVSRYSDLPEGSYRHHFPTQAAALIAAYDAFFDRLWLEVSAACEAKREWPHKIGAGLEVALSSFAEASALARVFVLEAPTTIGFAAREREFALIDGYATMLREGRRFYPDAAALPGLVERTLIGGAASIVAAHLLAEEPQAIARLQPELCEVLIAPYVGREEARRFARG